MNKLKFLTALSKALAYITWATSNVIHIVGKVSRKTIDQFSTTARYDVEIYHGNEQMDKRENINHAKLLKLINSIEVFPQISIIVTKVDKDNIVKPIFKKKEADINISGVDESPFG